MHGIFGHLREAELGTAVAEVCRKMGVSEDTFFRWKQKYVTSRPSARAGSPLPPR
nr:transposase [Pseudoroseomonas vastitatis]